MTISDYANVVMGICAVYAAWLSWKASQKSKDADANAKRSADAAEKSAMESEKSRKLVRFNTLADSFTSIEGYISAMKGERKIVKTDLYRAMSALESLKAAFPDDSAFINTLTALRLLADEKPGDGREVTRLADCGGFREDQQLNIRGWAPQNLTALEGSLKQAREQYLYIG